MPLRAADASFELETPDANGGLKAAVAFASVRPSSAASAVQHGHRAAVLAPAGDVVADRDRTLLAVGNGLHAVGGDSFRGQEVAGSGGTAGAEREVVFARAAL